MTPQSKPSTQAIYRTQLLGIGASNDNRPLHAAVEFPASLRALVEALARVQEERDHCESICTEAVQ